MLSLTLAETLPEVNQALYLKGEKILEIWPNLPDSVESLLGNSTSLSLLPSLQTVSGSAKPIEKPAREKEITLSRIRSRVGSKAYQQNLNRWRLALKLSWVLISLLFS